MMTLDQFYSMDDAERAQVVLEISDEELAGLAEDASKALSICKELKPKYQELVDHDKNGEKLFVKIKRKLSAKARDAADKKKNGILADIIAILDKDGAETIAFPWDYEIQKTLDKYPMLNRKSNVVKNGAIIRLFYNLSDEVAPMILKEGSKRNLW